MLTFVRCFSRSSANAKQRRLTWKHVEVVKNPENQDYEAFWKVHGSVQTDLKKTDLKVPKDSWGPDHHEAYTYLKNTDVLVSANSHTVFRPLDPKNEEVVFMGNFWISPNVTGIGNIVKQQSYDVRFAVGNSMMCADKKTLKWYRNMSGSKDSVLKHYVSYYDFGDLRIPEKLDLTGITVKNVKDVPDSDILNYDSKVFNYERSKYVLTQLRKEFGRVAYNENGDVVGFGAISVYPSGECSLSPLYADDKRVAQAILKDILEEMTLNSNKFWRLQVLSNDQFPESYGWIRPFVKTMTHRNESSVLMCDHKLKGVDFSKVYSSFPKQNCPI